MSRSRTRSRCTRAPMRARAARVLFQTNVHSPPAPSAMRNGWNHECPIRARATTWPAKCPANLLAASTRNLGRYPRNWKGVALVPLIAMIGVGSRSWDTVSKSFLIEVLAVCLRIQYGHVLFAFLLNRPQQKEVLNSSCMLFVCMVGMLPICYLLRLMLLPGFTRAIWKSNNSITFLKIT